MAEETEQKPRSKKAVVAETLYNLPQNAMSTGMIKWIMSHLPDENKKGENEVRVSAPGPELKFINVKDKGLHGAFNLTYEEMLALADKIEALFPEEEKNKDTAKGIPRVLLMEQLYPQLCDAEKAFLISLGVEPFGMYRTHEKLRKEGKLPDGIDSLLEMLKKLRDEMRKNGGNMEDFGTDKLDPDEDE